MKALSTFIKIYILSFIVFLIPSSAPISNYYNDKVASSSHIDIDESFPVFANSNNEYDIQYTTLVVSEKVEDIETEMDYFQFSIKPEKIVNSIKPDFWTTLHSIESKQGRLLYRPRNKNRNCTTTSSPCGHHQLSLQALKDISCSSTQCMKNREDFEQSLVMSKKLQSINDKRLKKAGYKNLPEYQKYLIHQQGATGLKIILAASQGDKLLSRNIKKNMAGNSPYSYKKLRKFGSKLAAKKFLSHWKEKWENEKKLIVASNTPSRNIQPVIKPEANLNLPLFNDYELQIALNLKI